MTGLKRVQVFISSPADVDPEATLIERATGRLAGIWKAHIDLTAKNWAREEHEAIRSFQEDLAAMSAFDIVFGVARKRIWQPFATRVYVPTN